MDLIRKKTLVVGLDAACWDYLDPLLQTGRLPTLQRLMNAGMWGTLHSTLPAWTPTAWASIITGKNPGKHGIFGMMWRRPGTYEFSPTNAQVRMGTPFWKRLNEHGLRVGLVNVPFTHPPDAVDGFVVCGFGTPSSVPDITYPPEVIGWIEERFGRYEPAVDTKLFRTARPSEILEAEQKHQARQIRIAMELADRYQVEVLAINLMLLDHANHYMPYMDQVEQAICQSDADLARLIQAFHPDNVLLISDHGSRRVKGVFLLYNWLLDHGYCAQIERTPSESSAALNWLLVNWLQGARNWSGLQEKILRHLCKQALLRLPDWITLRLWRSIERDIPLARQYVLLTDRTDYSRSRVFPEAQYSGLLYFNVAGREPTGVVPPQDQPALSAELATKVAQIVDPETGQSLFFGVYTPEDLYAGPAVEHAPDLILDSFDGPWSVMTSYRESLAGCLQNGYFADRSGDLGQHSRDGIFVFSGQDFNVGPASRDGHVMDIPATLLHLYGVPIPEDYDGRVMTETVTPAFAAQCPVIYQPGDQEATISLESPYSPEETEELLGHLRALGYMD